jgi:hypothetical protein
MKLFMIFYLGFLCTGCQQTVQEKPRRKNSGDYFKVVKDTKTGCEYLVSEWEDSKIITPRYSSDGKTIICSGKE